ncbi:asparagine synthase (glutamine-hydrolyzing) [bacterium]|nr:asparagine synthase (glutamine-hydrolyzing) [bacterium]
MCGILGFIGEPDPEGLARMMSKLAHRGPDGRGSWSDGQVHLGQTRLAIIDRASGHQPMLDEQGTLVIVFNGEIYDHALLRQRLQKAGHRFRTNSDTEVILEAYRAWGEDAVLHLDGMFAFVLYDRNRRLLFGARDRFGKKPLYFAQPTSTQVRFVFASESSSLNEHSALRSPRRLNEEGIVSYLVHDAVADPRSIWEGVQQLAPGHRFVLDLAGEKPIHISRFWDRQSAISAAGTPAPKSDPDRLISLLDDGVRRRWVADVPVGVFLSGGVDSSAVLALSARHRPASEIATFSIGFDDPSFDESPWAEQVARQLGTVHRHRLFNSREMLARLEPVIAQLDEPLADPSILPTALLSEFAREHVTVALSGEGGDELLAGYDPFRALSVARWYRRFLPRRLAPALGSFVRKILPRSDQNMSLDFKLDRFLRGMGVSAEIQLPTWMGSFSLDQLTRLIPSRRDRLSAEEVFADVLAFGRQVRGGDVDRALDFYQRFYLPNDILRKVDRASMMFGLELRCPFLDTAFAEYVNSLPAETKFARGVTKAIFKKGLRRQHLLPDQIIDRPKKGFGIPIARWLRTDLRSEVETHLVQDWPWALSFIDSQGVRDLVRDHLSLRANRAKELWSLLVLSKWVKSHLS